MLLFSRQFQASYVVITFYHPFFSQPYAFISSICHDQIQVNGRTRMRSCRTSIDATYPGASPASCAQRPWLRRTCANLHYSQATVAVRAGSRTQGPHSFDEPVDPPERIRLSHGQVVLNTARVVVQIMLLVIPY